MKTYKTFEQAIEHSLINGKIGMKKLGRMIENAYDKEDVEKASTLNHLYAFYANERELNRIVSSLSENDEEYIRACKLYDYQGYDGNNWEDLSIENTEYRDNKIPVLDEDVEEEKAEFKKLDSVTSDKLILSILNAIHGQYHISHLGWLDILGKIHEEDFKAYLKHHKKLIMTNSHGKCTVYDAHQPMTKKNITDSMRHFRDMIHLPETSLEMLEYGSLGKDISYLRRGYLYEANSIYESRTIVDEVKVNKMIFGHLCWEIAGDLFGYDTEESMYEMQVNRLR
jgi:hypothetical protein